MRSLVLFFFCSLVTGISHAEESAPADSSPTGQGNIAKDENVPHAEGASKSAEAGEDEGEDEATPIPRDEGEEEKDSAREDESANEGESQPDITKTDEPGANESDNSSVQIAPGPHPGPAAADGDDDRAKHKTSVPGSDDETTTAADNEENDALSQNAETDADESPVGTDELSDSEYLEDMLIEDDGAFEVTIVGNRVRRHRVAGSAHKVNEEDLERMEYDDVHRVLAQVPGVYTRDEDGQGLRPNIGLRGASSDRSSKVTLMEDGILLAPAPYAAPAAYYFPLSTRLVGVEVFKGPASIKNGPQTVGGAINLQTRRVPYGTTAGVDLAAGLYRSEKAHAYVGYGNEYVGFMLEGVHLGSDGFKKIDGGGDTGFYRNDLLFKGRLSTGYQNAVSHTLELKLGYGDEESHETYLGLADVDFDASPYRRYAASRMDLMKWQRTQAQLNYVFVWGDMDIQVTGYRHDFSRAWEKFNRFQSPLNVSQVLANPAQGQTALLYQVLTGQSDSELPEQTLRIGTNDRRFYSQGIQARGRYSLSLGQMEQSLELGLRWHQDEIRRLHDENGFLMRSGVLVPDGGNTTILADNTGRATALALYASDEIRWGNLLLAPGIRMERIETRFEDRQSGDIIEGTQMAWMPGIGVSYQLLPSLNVLAGAHKGFSPVSPGQPDEVLPEESWNYELGARFRDAGTRAELVGFWSQYTNLTGECTFSQGCIDDVINRQYNAGEVWVYGLEAGLGHDARLGLFDLHSELTYTLTLSRFASAFDSENPLFGRVEVGDELPYVPVHRGAGQIVLGWRERVEAVVSAAYTGQMRDEAGQGELPTAQATDAAFILDAGLSYRFTEKNQLYFRADNVLGTSYVASRRPFGARPGKPLSFMVGYKHTF